MTNEVYEELLRQTVDELKQHDVCPALRTKIEKALPSQDPFEIWFEETFGKALNQLEHRGSHGSYAYSAVKLAWEAATKQQAALNSETLKPLLEKIYAAIRVLTPLGAYQEGGYMEANRRARLILEK